MHPTAEVTVTDIEANRVKAIAAGALGEHPRATSGDGRDLDRRRRRPFRLGGVRVLVSPSAAVAAARVFAEGTRAADKLLIIDLPRPPSPLHMLRLAAMLPFAPFVPFVHDGVISSLRCYSPSALRALAAHADPASRSNCAAG